MTRVSERQRRTAVPARGKLDRPPLRAQTAELRADLYLLGELLLCLSLFGPQPLGWMYVAARLVPGSWFSVVWLAMVVGGIAVSATATLAGARRLEHGRLRARLESGHEQDDDLLALLLVGLTIVLVGCFAVWFFIIEGPEPLLTPGTG